MSVAATDSVTAASAAAAYRARPGERRNDGDKRAAELARPAPPSGVGKVIDILV